LRGAERRGNPDKNSAAIRKGGKKAEAKKRKKVWIASRHASLAVAMMGTAIAFFNRLLERFRQGSSHLKRSISLFLRNSERETGAHPRLRGGMLSLELL